MRIFNMSHFFEEFSWRMRERGGVPYDEVLRQLVDNGEVLVLQSATNRSNTRRTYGKVHFLQTMARPNNHTTRCFNFNLARLTEMLYNLVLTLTR